MLKMKAACLLAHLICLVWAKKNNMYTAEWERFDADVFDPSHVVVNGSCAFHNRTSKVLNMDITVKKELTEKFVVLVVFNKWINQNWVKYSAIRILETMKAVMNFEYFGLPKFCKEYFKPELTWPIQLITYRIRNYTFDSEDFPQYIPIGNFKVEITYYASRKLDHRLARLNCYINFVPLKPHEKD